MRYEVRKSVVQITGIIWLPPVAAALEKELSNHDVDNIRQYGDGKITRESVAMWIDTHVGDFSDITDFWASIESGDDTIDIPWDDPESMDRYSGLVHGEDVF